MALIALMIFAFLVGQTFAGCIGNRFGLDDYGVCSDDVDDLDVGYGYGDGYGYPGSVGLARENYVRGSCNGGAEIGTRDEINFRPGCPRPPYSRFYNNYYPYRSLYRPSLNSLGLGARYRRGYPYY